jgi:hypothetical protein
MCKFTVSGPQFARVLGEDLTVYTILCDMLLTVTCGIQSDHELRMLVSL